MSRWIDISGKKFGRWTAIRHIGAGLGRRAMWECLCECGVLGEVNSQDLRDGHSKSCGCIVKEKIGLLNRSKYSGRNKLLRQYKQSAKIRGLDFALTDDRFFEITSSPCHYCGEIPSRTSVKNYIGGAYKYNGIDRKDNSVGYTDENSLPCCYACNFFKSRMGYEEFVCTVQKIYLHLLSNPFKAAKRP